MSEPDLLSTSLEKQPVKVRRPSVLGKNGPPKEAYRPPSVTTDKVKVLESTPAKLMEVSDENHSVERKLSGERKHSGGGMTCVCVLVFFISFFVKKTLRRVVL